MIREKIKLICHFEHMTEEVNDFDIVDHNWDLGSHDNTISFSFSR